MSDPHPTDAEALARLREHGVGERPAHAWAALVARAQGALDDDGVPASHRRAWVAPGRIEVLGKHVDYAGGRSLVCAVDRGIVVVARTRDDRTVVVRDAVLGEAVTVPLDGEPAGDAPAWRPYVHTVVQRLARNFGEGVRGCDIALASNLPPAAGVSSSAALIVGLGLAVAHASGLPRTARWRKALPDCAALAGYFGAMENGSDFGPLAGERGLGLMNGAQDQASILCSRAGSLGVFAWAPVRHERWVTWPADHVFVVATSGVTAEKTRDALARYNRVSAIARHLAAAWRRATGGDEATLGDIVASAPDAAARLRAIARDAATDDLDATTLVARVDQFVHETTGHVPRAADALDRGDLAAFGAEVASSMRWAECALGNQVPETLALVEEALRCGAVAASAFGAGFGGSVWAMVPQADATPFTERWQRAYASRFPAAAARAVCFATRPGTAAFELEAG